jgi:hypothetical protein
MVREVNVPLFDQEARVRIGKMIDGAMRNGTSPFSAGCGRMDIRPFHSLAIVPAEGAHSKKLRPVVCRADRPRFQCPMCLNAINVHMTPIKRHPAIVAIATITARSTVRPKVLPPVFAFSI